MTKRDLTNWLNNKMCSTIMEMRNEIEQRRDAALEAVLHPLGFYEMTGQIENHIKQAWDIWIQWKISGFCSALS